MPARKGPKKADRLLGRALCITAPMAGVLKVCLLDSFDRHVTTAQREFSIIGLLGPGRSGSGRRAAAVDHGALCMADARPGRRLGRPDQHPHVLPDAGARASARGQGCAGSVAADQPTDNGKRLLLLRAKIFGRRHDAFAARAPLPGCPRGRHVLSLVAADEQPARRTHTVLRAPLRSSKAAARFYPPRPQRVRSGGRAGAVARRAASDRTRSAAGWCSCRSERRRATWRVP